jgi:acyl-CoA thioester hydrolase
MLRENGISYRELEESGLMLVVKTLHVDFHVPAEFDDELELTTTLCHCHGAKVEHAYDLRRPRCQSVIVTGHSTIACIDRSGKVRRLPKQLQLGLIRS